MDRSGRSRWTAFRNKLKVIVRRSYGFRDVTTNALYHGMGNLPEPTFPHRFC